MAEASKMKGGGRPQKKDDWRPADIPCDLKEAGELAPETPLPQIIEPQTQGQDKRHHKPKPTLGDKIKRGLHAVGFSILVGSQVIAATPTTLQAGTGERPPMVSVESTRTEIQLSRVENTVKAFAKQEKNMGFYDYQRGGRPKNTADINPASINIPANAWPRNATNGFPAFLESMKAIDRTIRDPRTTPQQRAIIFEGLNRIIRENPFLQYQAFYEKTRETDAVPNNIFTQHMSRTLMLAAVQATPGTNPEEEMRTLAESLFPKTRNGQLGAKLLQKHGILLAGFGVQADTEREHYRTINHQNGWKAVKGTHGGGIFDYAYFTDEYTAKVEHLMDLYPKHLIQGGGNAKPTTITAHGYNYIYEMEDFAAKYHPSDAGIRNTLGHLHGQTLNVYGPRTINMGDSIEKIQFASSQPGKTVAAAAHPQLVNFSHELVHLQHAVLAAQRPDLQRRLSAIIALGVREKTSIRDIDCDAGNFAGTGVPAHVWFSRFPQEAAATLANVAYVCPETVLGWCATKASGPKPRIQPLNHLLWMLDINSLDPNYRETDKSFLLTLQPDGTGHQRMEFALERDSQGRISGLKWENGGMTFSYGTDGFARVEKTEPK